MGRPRVSSNPPVTDCLFCDVVARRYPAEFVLETPVVVAFMDQLRQPEDVGHVLVIPRAHVENIYGVDDALGAALFNAHARIARAVKRALAPDGITTWSSNERGAGQEIPHFHLHVFPRRTGSPFPIARRVPEMHLPASVLAPAAARIREALTAL